jgi:tRNA U38,U39,U40 pseudouridine synthase TruA
MDTIKLDGSVIAIEAPAFEDEMTRKFAGFLQKLVDCGLTREQARDLMLKRTSNFYANLRRKSFKVILPNDS